MAARSATLLAVAVALAGCGRDAAPPGPAHATAPAPVAAPVKPAAPLAVVPESGSGSGSAQPKVDRAALAKMIVADTSGKRGPLGDRMRQVTLLAFWASWCHPCMQEMPQLAKYAASQHDQRVAVIAVSVDDDRAAAVKAMAHFRGLTVVLDPKQELYGALFGFDMMTIPATAVISPDGIDADNSGYEPGNDDEVIQRFAGLVAAHLH